MSAFPDYYSTLGVEMKASQKEIVAAYRSTAKRFHPDLFRTKSSKFQQEANRRMQVLNEAFDTLRHPERRRAYDRIYSASNPSRSRSNPNSAQRPTSSSTRSSASGTAGTSPRRTARQDNGAPRSRSTPPPSRGASSAGQNNARQQSRPFQQRPPSVLSRFLNRKLFVGLLLAASIWQMMNSSKSPANTGIPEFHQFPNPTGAPARTPTMATSPRLSAQHAAAPAAVKSAAHATSHKVATEMISGKWSDGQRILDFDSCKKGWHPIFAVVKKRNTLHKGALLGHFQSDGGRILTRPLHSINMKSGLASLSKDGKKMTIRDKTSIATLVLLD